MIRLLLPPNLANSAPRDAIALKVEVDLSRPPAPELLPALAALQRMGAAPAPVLFLQLTRAQLSELVNLLRGQPVFAFVNAPQKTLLWVGPLLRGVSESLKQPEAPKPPPAAPQQSKIENQKSKIPRERDLVPLTVDGSQHFLAITLPSRESHAYGSALELLKDHGFRLEPSNRKWWLRDRHKTLAFLSTHLDTLREDFQAEFTPNFERNTANIVLADVETSIRAAEDGFEVTVGLRAGDAPPAAIASALTSSRGYVEAGDKIYLIDQAAARRVGAVQSALAGDQTAIGGTRQTHHIPASRAAEVDDLLEDLAPGFKSPAAWRQLSSALRDLSTLRPAPLPTALESILRPYQKLGVAWLHYLHHHELGGILADEMGLGKTLQALALVASLRSAKILNPKSQIPTSDAPSPTLIIAPASLVENWRREAARFVPNLRVFVHHANSRLNTATDAAAHDLIITSYGTLANDRAIFAQNRWCTVIADEAQHIKNRRTRNAKALRALDASSRFLLTGTPLENSLEDLRSLFEFLLPGFLKPIPTGTRGDDRRWYDDRLRTQTAPYILRRTKTAVAPELPPKIEQVVYCDLSPEQAALYRRTHEDSERALFDLEASGASQNALRLATLTQLLRLRQTCCDPRLVQKEAPPEWSAKLAAFRELLDEIVDEGHRVLVFSQFTSLLALLRAELDATEVPYAYLDGAMNPKQRQAAVDAFQSDDSIPVFFLSLKAGGTGLNLTGADTVIHFDPWWNPAVEAQATDRAHRIGQDRVVTSYKLICSNTVEEKVLGLQEQKRALLADVFEASDAAAAKLELADLRDLLK
ncbi:DEAD/DEAH box helicase [Actomonas aquatica]|uniref:DEAD/DEAH box helicase n=1 Tax=Actomonas aquatica TaxID=2866162 RepID=A0ABZ1C8A9_9BACT|nr:DEAD/DEAH box helicase [Opitutus sp. WL0086]WRQ87850.1 DEAD/DEAH box helicase [Opitutus sp. WL0086]